MRKFLSFLLALTVCTTLISCGGQPEYDRSDTRIDSSSKADQSANLSADNRSASGSTLPAGSEELPASDDSSDDFSGMNGDEWWVHWLADVDSGRYVLYMYHSDDQDSFYFQGKEYGDENIYIISGTYAKKDDGNFVLLSEYGDVYNLCVRDGEAVLTRDTILGELTFTLPDNPSNPFKDMKVQTDWLEGKIDIS